MPLRLKDPIYARTNSSEVFNGNYQLDYPNKSGTVALTSDLPTVNDATLTITQNGTSAGTFSANASSNATIALTDTTYSDMTGATSSTAGTGGLVPAPAAGDQEKFLKGDGTWTAVSGGGGAINDGRLTIQHNGTNVQTFTANQSSNATANIQTIYASTVSPASQVAQISTSSIQDEAITTAKIDDEAVTAAKIAWSSIFERIQVTVNLDASGNATIGVGPADYWVVSVCELTTGGRNGNIVPYVWTDGKYWIHVDQNFNHAYITGNITVEVLLIKRSAIGM